MEATARYLNNVKFEASARGHRLICDQPTDNGGADEGMTPPEFLLVALATCAGYYAARYLNARKLPTGGLEVRVNAAKAQAPARLASFHVEVSTPALKEHREAERRHAGVLRAVKSCLIHNTLLGNPSIKVSLRESSGREASENVALPAALQGRPNAGTLSA